MDDPDSHKVVVDQGAINDQLHPSPIVNIHIQKVE